MRARRAAVAVGSGVGSGVRARAGRCSLERAAGRRGALADGYTVVEVMMALSLLVIALAGIVSLQKVAIYGNMRAKNLAVADQIARTWVERLRTESAAWNYPSPSSPSTPSDLAAKTNWLKVVDTNNGWFEPAAVQGWGSPAADALGNDVYPPTSANAVYCTHLRLNWMYPDAVVRADVRVFWARAGGPGTFNNTPICGNPTAAYIQNFDKTLASSTPLSRYHFTYLSSSIMKNVAP